MSASFPANPSAVPASRRSTGEFAAAQGMRGQQLEDLRLAVSEAVTNVVLHAYRDRPGEVHVSARRSGNDLYVVVSDDGCGPGTPSTKSGLGVGLSLIRKVADGFTIKQRRNGGTELTMRFMIRVGR
jgi:serine/threonine-protein kinase RsbW